MSCPCLRDLLWEAVEALVTQVERDGAKKMQPPLDPAIMKRLRERLGPAPS